MSNLIICHRGVFRNKENKFESIVSIKTLNHPGIIFGVEFDVQLTKDNKLVCYHDETLDRLHKDSHKLCEYIYDEIKNYDIPLFDEILDDLLDDFKDRNDYLLNIELKFYEDIEDKDNNSIKIKNLCELIISKIKNRNLIGYCLVSSFNNGIVNELLNNYDISTGLILYDNYKIDEIEKFINKGLQYLVIDKNIVDEIFSFPFLKMVNILIYTFFDDENEEQDIQDIQIINTLKSRNNIGFITDDYSKMIKLLI